MRRTKMEIENNDHFLHYFATNWGSIFSNLVDNQTIGKSQTFGNLRQIKKFAKWFNSTQHEKSALLTFVNMYVKAFV